MTRSVDVTKWLGELGGPDGFSIRVGTGQKEGDKKVFQIIPCDVAQWNDETLAWVMERGLACLHGEKLNNVPADGGAKAREAAAAVAQANGGMTPQILRTAAPAKTGAIGDPVLGRAVADWIVETDGKLNKMVKSAKGRSKPNEDERAAFRLAHKPFSDYVDAQGAWAIGKVANVIKTNEKRLAAARDALAQEADAAQEAEAGLPPDFDLFA